MQNDLLPLAEGGYPSFMDATEELEGMSATQRCQVVCWDQGSHRPITETVAEEMPVALVYNGVSHAVMLASPQDLEDFALGFSLGEGILCQAGELFDVELMRSAAGIEVQMQIASRRMHALRQRRRNLLGRTGCGLCGTENLGQLLRPPGIVTGTGRVRGAALHRAMAELQAQQYLHHLTGAVHAAGWAAWDGQIQMLREDIGRHNALDKLIGALARQETDPRSGFVVMTSRASYELVQKTASAGIQLLAAISAPTSMAMRLAEDTGVTLAGFVRPGKHVLYAHHARVLE